MMETCVTKGQNTFLSWVSYCKYKIILKGNDGVSFPGYYKAICYNTFSFYNKFSEPFGKYVNAKGSHQKEKVG